MGDLKQKLRNNKKLVILLSVVSILIIVVIIIYNLQFTIFKCLYAQIENPIKKHVIPKKQPKLKCTKDCIKKLNQPSPKKQISILLEGSFVSIFFVTSK